MSDAKAAAAPAAAAAAAPAKKKRAASKPRAKSAKGKASAGGAYQGYIVAAIAGLKERGGSSRQAIKAYVLKNNKVLRSRHSGTALHRHHRCTPAPHALPRFCFRAPPPVAEPNAAAAARPAAHTVPLAGAGGGAAAAGGGGSGRRRTPLPHAMAWRIQIWLTAHPSCGVLLLLLVLPRAGRLPGRVRARVP